MLVEHMTAFRLTAWCHVASLCLFAEGLDSPAAPPHLLLSQDSPVEAGAVKQSLSSKRSRAEQRKTY